MTITRPSNIYTLPTHFFLALNPFPPSGRVYGFEDQNTSLHVPMPSIVYTIQIGEAQKENRRESSIRSLDPDDYVTNKPLLCPSHNPACFQHTTLPLYVNRCRSAHAYKDIPSSPAYLNLAATYVATVLEICSAGGFSNYTPVQTILR